MTSVRPTARPDLGAHQLVASITTHAHRLGAAVFRKSVTAQGDSRWRMVAGCPFARRYVQRQAISLEPPPLDAPVVVGEAAQAFARQLFPRAPEVPAAIVRLGENRLLMLALRDPLCAEDVAALGRLAGPLGDAFDASESLLLLQYQRRAEQLSSDLIRDSPLAIVLEGPDGRLRFANHAFCDLVGLHEGPDFPAGLTIEELDAHLAPVYHTVTKTPLENGETMWSVLLTDGRIVECNYASLMGGRGGKLWYYRDVTAKTLQEQEREQARRFYERILAALPADLAVFDPDGRYVFVTPSAVADPQRRAEMIGKTNAEYAALRKLPDDVAQRRIQQLETARQTGQPQRFEESFPDRAGRMRHFVRFHAPVHDDHGALVYLIGYGLDVTAEREATKALALSEALKHGIVESSLDGIVTMDASGQILDFNPSAEAIFGRSAQEVRGLNYADVLLAPECRTVCHDRMRRFLAHPPERPEDRRLETLGMHAGGRIFPVEMSLSLVHVDGLAPTLTASLRDLTAQKAAERERAAHRDALAAANASLERTVAARTHDLREALARAEDAGRLKDAILQNVTHEFRTPLAVILGSASILHDEADAPLREFSRAILQSGDRLLHLLDAVVELSQLKAKVVAVQPQPVCLAEHARRALDAVQPYAAAKGLALRYVGPDAPPPLHTDPALLSRLLHHLLDNAVKFTSDGAVTVEVQVTRRGVGLTVRDTGIGMDAAFLPLATQPFTQASSGLARSHEGAGVGLAVAQGLAECLGTTLSLESTPGEGTAVHFSLPEASPPAPVEQPLAHATA